MVSICMDGYKVQIEEYGKAGQTDQLIYALVDLGYLCNIKEVETLHVKQHLFILNIILPDLIVI